jgi:oligosaccharide repeat unit polymerase
MMRYVKSRDFPIHLMCYWWMFWILLSKTSLYDFVQPSAPVMGQLGLLIGAFLIGHLCIKLGWSSRARGMLGVFSMLNFTLQRTNFVLYGGALICLLLLLSSLQLAGAFSETFIEYFAKIRLSDSGTIELTGIHLLDVLSKIFAFPLSYALALVVLGNEMRRYRWVFWICCINLLLYCYLWQVNYPLIHLSWFFIFSSMLPGTQKKQANKKTLVIAVILFCLLLASAANRFGGDVMGGLQRYIVGYHLVGFSYYDSQFRNPDSILHSLSWGRSSLGFIDQVVEAAAKFFAIDYHAASSDNSTYTNDAVDIGINETREFNAFGTLLFTFYRDFDLLGIVIGGFLYGAITTYFLYRSAVHWKARALFLFLASTWMIGMMVSPPEQAYFWFTVVIVHLVAYVSGSIRFYGGSFR